MNPPPNPLPPLIRADTWLAQAWLQARQGVQHQPYIGRFAPSPSGKLHQGSLITALASYLHARWHHGQWLVRMEDIDTTRCTRAVGEHQLSTLRQMGFDFPLPVLWQTERYAVYRSEFERLRTQGLVYPCTCSRAQMVQQTHHHCPTGRMLRLPIRAWRFHSAAYAEQFGSNQITWHDPTGHTHTQTIDDFTLRRGDLDTDDWTYPFAVVVDDAAQHISHVVRGADLVEATGRQIALLHALGYPTPTYNHVPLLLNAQGDKLSKSEQAPELNALNPLDALMHAWQFLGGQRFACAGVVDFWENAGTIGYTQAGC